MFTDHFGHYMPITWLTLGIDYVIWGLNPFGYHLTNLLLHSTNAVLCYFLLRNLLRRCLPDENPGRLGWMALAGALFFSLHPLRVESVAWVTERRDLVSGLFFLPSLLAYLRSTEDTSRGKWLALSIGAFACSMLCKAMGMTLPLVLLILDAWPLGRYDREKPKSVLLEKLPYLAVMATAAALSAWAQHDAKAVYTIQEYPPSQILAQPGYRVSFYVLKTLLPFGLSPLYFYRRELGAAHVMGWIAVLAVTAFVLLRRRQLPGPAVVWAAFLLLIAPVSGFVQAGPHFAADRYTYLACLPFAALFAGILGLPPGGTARRAAAAAAACVLVGFAALTVRQCGYWRNSIALWDRALSIEPDVYFSLQNRASAKSDLFDWPGALADFDRAIDLNPKYPNSWYGRGIARANLGDPQAALEDLNVSLKLAPAQAGTLSSRGLTRAMLGDRAGAIADADEALRLAPDSYQPNLHRGLIRFQFGDMPGAIVDFSHAIQVAPESSLAWFNRGLAASRIGRPKEALADFRRATELRPDYAEALAQRGLSRALLNEPAPGLADLTQSLRIKPDAPTFLYRAAVRGMLGDFRGSVEDCDQSLRMKPDVPEAYLRRGAAFLALGDRTAAARDLQKTLELAPPQWPQRRQAEDLLFRAVSK